MNNHVLQVARVVLHAAENAAGNVIKTARMAAAEDAEDVVEDVAGNAHIHVGADVYHLSEHR